MISQVGSIVDLHVNYIASIDSSTETGFDCMHGQSEVTNLNLFFVIKLFLNQVLGRYSTIVCLQSLSFKLHLVELYSMPRSNPIQYS